MTFDAATWFAVRGSGLLRGLGGLAALGLSAMVLVGAVSDYYAIARPEVALAWSPGHPEALAEAAERSFEYGDPAARRAAFDLARRVMIASPLAPTPLRLLALEAEEREEQAKAVRLMRLAAERSPRDAKAQIWLADQALLTDDYGAGLERVDALLRIWPGLGTTLFPALARMSTEEEASAALLDTIRKNPPWRSALLAAMPSTVHPPGLMAAFYLKAMVGEGALTDRDLRPFLQTLINQGFPDLARSIWLASLSEERRLDAEGITNGDFDYPITGTGFDWRINRAEGADIRVVTDQTRGKTLKIDFYGNRLAFRHLSQILMLSPGRYTLTGASKASRLENDAACIGSFAAIRRSAQPWGPATGCGEPIPGVSSL